MTDNILTREIIGAAIEVHKHWGPGLFEKIYETSLCLELNLRNISFVNQVQIPLTYKGHTVGNDLRLDLLVDNTVVVEIKAISSLELIHEVQLLTYMKLTKCRIGLLINFNTTVLKSGIKRMVF